MIRINKNLLKFTTLGLFLAIGMLIMLSRLLPLFFQQSVYVCQQFINSFSIKVPHQTGLIILGILLVILLLAIKKFLIIFFEIRRLRAQLILYKKVDKTLGNVLKKHHLQKSVFLVQSEKTFAFCYGIRFPKIYISTSLMQMMSNKELEAILLHEKYHLKNRDSLIMFLASFIQLFFPFFPLVTDLLAQYKINREIEADKEAIESLGDRKAIISVLKKFLALPSSTFATASAIADYETLEPRIKALVNQEKSPVKVKISHVFISFFSLAILATVIITPVHATEMHMPQQDTTMLCLQGDACAKWCKEHNSVTPYSSNVSKPYSPVNSSQPYNPEK